MKKHGSAILVDRDCLPERIALLEPVEMGAFLHSLISMFPVQYETNFSHLLYPSLITSPIRLARLQPQIIRCILQKLFDICNVVVINQAIKRNNKMVTGYGLSVFSFRFSIFSFQFTVFNSSKLFKKSNTKSLKVNMLNRQNV